MMSNRLPPSPFEIVLTTVGVCLCLWGLYCSFVDQPTGRTFGLNVLFIAALWLWMTFRETWLAQS